MHLLLNKQTSLFFKKIGQQPLEIFPDLLARDYAGLTIKTAFNDLIYRKAKVTPKKNGLFVTLWKRNLANISTPYHTKDNFDCCMVEVEDKEQLGFFIFPKAILVEKAIVSTNQKEGKRGFRVYPDWDIPQSVHAKKTQEWQSRYFIKVTEINEINLSKIEQLLTR